MMAISAKNVWLMPKHSKNNRKTAGYIYSAVFALLTGHGDMKFNSEPLANPSQTPHSLQSMVPIANVCQDMLIC